MLLIKWMGVALVILCVSSIMPDKEDNVDAILEKMFKLLSTTFKMEHFSYKDDWTNM